MHEEIIELTYQKPYSKTQESLGKRIKKLMDTGEFEQLSIEELDMLMEALELVQKQS